MMLHLKAKEVLLLASKSEEFTQEISQPNFKHEQIWLFLEQFNASVISLHTIIPIYITLHKEKIITQPITGCTHLVLSTLSCLWDFPKQHEGMFYLAFQNSCHSCVHQEYLHDLINKNMLIFIDAYYHKVTLYRS